MTRKQRRLTIVVVALSALAITAGLVLAAFRDNLVYFHGPSEVAAHPPPAERRFRIGGLIKPGSVERQPGGVTLFVVTDGKADVAARYIGVLPDLFREGQGVVALGRLDGKGTFEASEVLAKHDENYMPPEVADALKKSGHWQDNGQYKTGSGG